MQDACVRTRLGRVLVFLALCAFLLTTQMYDGASSLNYNYYRDYAHRGDGSNRGSVATNLSAGTHTVRITSW